MAFLKSGHLLRRRFGLVLCFPLAIGHAIDTLFGFIDGHFEACLVGSLAVPAREAIAAKITKDHQVDVLYIGALPQMHHETAEGGGVQFVLVGGGKGFVVGHGGAPFVQTSFHGLLVAGLPHYTIDIGYTKEGIQGTNIMPIFMHVGTTLSSFAAAAVLSGQASATWSIVAVDTETGEVGMAAATCNSSIQFIAAAVPGRGVVAAQAETSFKGRDAAITWIDEGMAADKVLQRLANPDFYSKFYNKKFPVLQYGVATFDETPDAGFVGGDNLVSWSGGIAEDASHASWSVQGNTLRGPKVIAAAAVAMEPRMEGACHLTLGERLLRALEAGREAGGDKRCTTDKPAQSAILLIARPEDVGDPATRLVAPRSISFARSIWHFLFGYEPEPGVMEPVAQLRQKWANAGGQTCHPEA